jgi:polysaccharide export outer membrane protein
MDVARIRSRIKQQGTRPWRVCLLLVVLLAGCSARGLSLFPTGECLTKQAKALRAARPVPVALPRELQKGVTGPFVIEPGDVLLVNPANLDSPVRLPGDQPVLPDGTINLGQYGRVQVAGQTVEQVQAQVQRLIESKTKDAGPITVRLATRQSKLFYVLGEVNAPGSFTLNGYETVLDALIAAGGLTENASRRDIILSRPSAPGSCRIVLPICYYDIVQLGDTSTNYQIRPGDRIFVATRSFLEGLFHHNKDNPPCGGPQFPCPLPTEPGPGPCLDPVVPGPMIPSLEGMNGPILLHQASRTRKPVPWRAVSKSSKVAQPRQARGSE